MACIIFPYILAKEEIIFLAERHLMWFFKKHELQNCIRSRFCRVRCGSVTNFLMDILVFVYLKSQYFLNGCATKSYLNIHEKILT